MNCPKYYALVAMSACHIVSLKVFIVMSPGSSSACQSRAIRRSLRADLERRTRERSTHFIVHITPTDGFGS
jgi:hypothetical protein